MAPTPIYEIVTFRLNPGVASDELRSVAARVDPLIRTFPGLLSRELLHDAETGEWIELCRWASLRQAQEAAAAALNHPGLAPYFALMDMASLGMRHVPIVPLAPSPLA